MTTAEARVAPFHAGARFAPYHEWDRNAFLILLGFVWLGVAMGFGPAILQHVRSGESYPLIIHLHAAAFVGWVVLLTAQILLIRGHRPDLHRRLGLAGMVLAPTIVIVGTATGIIVEQMNFGTRLSRPPFMAIEFTDMLAFAGLAGAALVWRGNTQAHKRLILLATFYIVDAGYSRWLGAGIHAIMGSGYWSRFTGLFLGPDLLLLGLGGYDLVTRGRLHPAYVAGGLWMLACQFGSLGLYRLPQWKPVALAIIGH
jgi:uncharacterized membrane protein YozB (DUF420 family)